MMNSLFEFTRIIEGNISFDIPKVNICNTVRDALSAADSKLGAKGFIVDADIPDTPVFCLCDEDALRRVLQNLFKNVCVHGKEALRVRLDGSVTEISSK